MATCASCSRNIWTGRCPNVYFYSEANPAPRRVRVSRECGGEVGFGLGHRNGTDLHSKRTTDIIFKYFCLLAMFIKSDNESSFISNCSLEPSEEQTPFCKKKETTGKSQTCEFSSQAVFVFHRQPLHVQSCFSKV